MFFLIKGNDFFLFKGNDIKIGHVFESGASFDYLENALGKFDDGPFFLGEFSLVS